MDAHQERLGLQSARVFEVNQQLRALMDSSEKVHVIHMHHVNQNTPLICDIDPLGLLNSVYRKMGKLQLNMQVFDTVIYMYVEKII